MRSNAARRPVPRWIAGVVPRAVIGAAIAVAVAASCSSRDSAGPPRSGNAVAAPPMSPGTPATGPGSAPGRSAGADAPPSPPPVDAPRIAAGASEPPAQDPQPPAPGCDGVNVDDLITQAQNQYAAGFASSALSVMTKALQCRQDARMYRYAATYACAAHDAASVRRFFSKVPPQFQPALIQRCMQEGVSLP